MTGRIANSLFLEANFFSAQGIFVPKGQLCKKVWRKTLTTIIAAPAKEIKSVMKVRGLCLKRRRGNYEPRKSSTPLSAKNWARQGN